MTQRKSQTESRWINPIEYLTAIRASFWFLDFVKMAFVLLRPTTATVSFPLKLKHPTSKSRKMAIKIINSSSNTTSTGNNGNRKLPILLFDIMDTIVRDPFYHDVPAFFRYSLFNSFYFLVFVLLFFFVL